MTSNPRLVNWWPYLAVAGPVLLYFLPLVAQSAPLDFGGDVSFYFYPLTAAGMAQWHAGHVPLWTADIQTGFPLLADGQGALVYPLNLLAYWLTAGPLAFKLVIFIQTAVSATLMYALARELRLSAMPAILAAWIWAAVVVVGAQSSPQLNTLAWWPLLVRLALRIGVAREMSGHVPATGLVTGLMWLGGFPQTALYGVVLATAFLAYATYSVSRLEVSGYLRPAGFWALGLVLGVGMAAIQLVPTLEMAAQSIRSAGIDYGLATQGSLAPTGLLGYLTPGWSVEGGLSGRVYVGIVALSLALLRLRRGASGLDKFLWLACGLTFLLALGRYGPLYYFVTKLPGLSSLRVPFRFAYLATFCLALLAGRGLDQFIAAIFSPTSGDQTIGLVQKRLRALVLLLTGVSLVGGVAARLAQPWLIELARRVVQGSLLGTRYRLQGWDYYNAKIDTLYSQITHSLSPLNPATLQPIVVCLLALLAVTCTRNGRHPHFGRRVPAVLFLLMGLEMALLAGNPFDRLSPAELLTAPKLVAQLQKEAPPSPTTSSRLYELVTADEVTASARAFANLTPNFNLLYGVPHTGASSALGSLRYFDFLGPLGGVNLAYGLPPSSPEALRQNLHLLSLLGARYVIASQPLDDPRLTLIATGDPFVYLNPGALPRAFMASKAMSVSPDEALTVARSPAFAPLGTVVLEAEDGVEFQPSDQAPSAEIVEAGDVMVRVRTQGTGWLVLTDLYYPGWRAEIDGVEAPIYRADAVFRAVAITRPGVHLVSFRYEPTSFARGTWLSALSLLLILCAYGLTFRKPACNLQANRWPD